MTDQQSTGQKFRAVFLAAVMVLSVVAMSTAFVGGAAANVTTAGSPGNVTVGVEDTSQTISGIEVDDDATNVEIRIENLNDTADLSNIDNSNVTSTLTAGSAVTVNESTSGPLTITIPQDNNPSTAGAFDVTISGINTEDSTPQSGISYTVIQSDSSTTDSFSLVGATDVTAEGLDTTVTGDTAAVEVSHSDAEDLTEIGLYDADGNNVANFSTNDGAGTNGLDAVQTSNAGNTTFILNVTELNDNYNYALGTGTVYAASESADDQFGTGISGGDAVSDSAFQQQTNIQFDGLVVTDLSFPQVAANATTQTAEVTVENLGSNTVEQNVSVVVSDDLTDTSSGLDLTTGTFNQTLLAAENLSVNAGNTQTVTVAVDTGTLPNATNHGDRVAYEIAGYTSGSPYSAVTQNLFVGADTGGSASITAVDPNSNPKTNGEIKLFLQPQNTPLTDEVLVDSIQPNSNGVATFNDLATGSASNSEVTYRATFESNLNTETSTNTTVSLFEPDDTSRSSSVTVRSSLEPEVFGVGAFDSENEQVVGDSRTLFGNGEFDNQGEFAVFAQTQSTSEDAQPVNQDVSVTLTVENGTSSPLRFVDPANAGENATQITVTITPDSNVANVDGNDSTGVYSYETFSVTADNASSETLTDPITTEDFSATTPDIGSRTVDVDPDVTATSDNSIASAGGTVLQNSVSYVLQGDQTITGEVRDGIDGEDLGDINVWVAYDGQSDKSLEFVSETFRNSADEPFLSTTSASDGDYTINGLAGTSEDFTVYAYSENNQLYNQLNKSGTPVDGAETQGAIAHEQNLTTGSATGDSLTHDIPLFEEEVEFEYRLNVTVQDSDNNQAKSVEVPQDGQRTVEVTVEQRPVDRGNTDFAPADDGQEITLDLIDNPTPADNVGELSETTRTTTNGTVETTFTAFEAGSGFVNVTAETENDDGTTVETTADEQAQIEVFGTATITGDVVNDNSENLPNATVELYAGADTTGTPLATDRTGTQGSYTFTEIDGQPIQTGESFTVRAEDEEGNFETRQFNNLQGGTNDGDIVIVGGVPGEVDDGNNSSTDATERVLQIVDEDDVADLTQDDVTTIITLFNRDATQNSVDVDQDDVTNAITLFERNR